MLKVKMKNKQNFILLILVHIIFICSAITTVYSFFCFATYEKISSVVTDIDSYYEGDILYLIYTVDGVDYEKKQNCNGTSSIKVGTQFTVWYNRDNPEKVVSPQDFKAYYYLAAIMGFPLLLYWHRILRNKKVDNLIKDEEVKL